MESKFEHAKQAYQSVVIPEALDGLVDKSMDRAVAENHRLRKQRWRWRQLAGAAAIAFITFVAGVNTNDAFAMSMEKIPLIRQLAQLVTVQETHEDLEVLMVNAVIPAVEGIADKALEQRINQEILERMNQRIHDAEQRAQEYKAAYVETGGDPDSFHDLGLDIGYELKSVTDHMLSFEIYSVETMASAYTEYDYYNIDLAQNKELSLEDVLGSSYVDKIRLEVQKQVSERMQNPDYTYFEDSVEALIIDADRPFYINASGQVVVVFRKYEIAPGAMGKQEFIIN